jgi:hypothetical protein
VVAGEGLTLTEEMMPGVPFVLFDCVEVPEGNRVVDPLESVAPGLIPLVEPPPHPQPQSVRVTRKMARRRNGDLLG